jgi:hypothetical protein
MRAITIIRHSLCVTILLIYYYTTIGKVNNEFSSLIREKSIDSSINLNIVPEDDRRHMLRALQLASKALGNTRPNPCVGCVIVDRDGEVVGEGFHQRAGGPHAEVAALRQAGHRAQAGTAYVSLEPCNHYGRTPPCTIALLK